MHITVLVRSKAKIEKVERIEENSYVVYTRAIPQQGLANKAVIRNLAKHFGVAKKYVKVLIGPRSKHKLVEIAEEEETINS